MNASNYHLIIKMDCIRGFSRILSKFHTICYDLLELLEDLLQRTPLDGCFYTFWKHLFFRTVFYIKKSEKSMTLWINLLPSAKYSNFFGFLLHISSCKKYSLICCLTFGTWWDHIILYLIDGILSSFRASWLIFKQFFER